MKINKLILSYAMLFKFFEARDLINELLQEKRANIDQFAESFINLRSVDCFEIGLKKIL